MSISSLLNKIDHETIVPKVYSKVVLSNTTKQRLLSYQEKHVIKLINILLEKNIAADTSDTGIGKTYIGSAVCKELERRPIIICPKTLIFNWINVLEYLGVKAYDIVNYETIKNGKTYAGKEYKSRKKSRFLEVVEPNPDDPRANIFQWTLPKDALIIFDEVHRCKDPSTGNGKLLMSSIQAITEKTPVLILSATICETFADVKIPFYLFGFIPSTRNFNNYILLLKQKYPQHIVKRKDFVKRENYNTARENAQAIMIYEEIKEYTSRIRIKDLGDKFPSNQWCCQQFMAEESDKIAEAYAEMAEHLEELKNGQNNAGSHHLAKIQKLKQEIEFRKIPIFIEQAQLYLDEGKSVIIFVNYLDTLNFIVQELDVRCVIQGSQDMQQRQEAIDLFQSNKERIIVLQMQAGSVGISLHDIHGDHPRVSLINFPDAASVLIQALGRAARAGAKSPVLQRIIFVANVDYEKKIMQNINRKLINVSAINDGDLDGYKYKVKKITRRVVNNKAKEDPNLDEDQHILKEFL